MSEKLIKTRIVQKHDIESNWNKATNFIPKQGELIIYDKDTTHSYERFKIGDGSTVVTSLPFATDVTLAQAGKAADAKAVGDALTNKVDTVSGKGLSTNDFTTAEKEKLAGIATGANKITVDSALSSTSTNPVQNKVVNSALAGKADSSHTHTKSQITDFPTLATVATSGSYNDLSNKPTIPTKSSWNYDDSYVKYSAAQSLTTNQKSQARSNIGAGTSNFSGDYNDLTNKPNIPTVNNGTLTIQKNGTTVNTFTANSSSNVTANITVPTKVSELTNDSGYKTTDNNTTYDLAASASSANGNVKLNLTAGGSGSGTDSVTIKGAGTTTVTSDSSGVITVSSSAHPTALKNPNALTIGGKSYDGSSAVSVSASDLGIANAIHFIGETTTALTDGAATTPVAIGTGSVTPVSGDVVLYNSKEFIWNGSAWKELGDGSSHALNTITITAGNGLTGGGNLTTNRTLAVGQGNGITVSADAVAAKAGSGITVDSTGINHADTSSQVSVTADGRKYITGVTLDTYGHVTGLTTGTESVTDTNQKVKVGTTTFGANDTVEFVAGSNVTLTPDATNDKITITATDTVYTHPTYTAYTGKPTANQTPAFGGTATVSQITSNATGHVTGMTDRTITIPSTLSNGTGTAGLIKTTSTVTSNSGYTACPVISGVPYYKDTNTTYTHPTSGVTAGSYNKVTVDANGHVTSGSNPTSLSGHGITDAYTKTEVDNLLAGKQNSGSYAPASHNHSSNEVTAMTGYSKASSAAAIATTDSLNTAIGKLEKSLDGKAASSHGTHVTYGSTATAVGSTASAGSATTVSRSDHVHSLPAATSTTLGGVKLTLNGTTLTISTT